ncbi:MarR family transcriptional regulator [Burkholderia sp. Bp8963]|uniref:MarR family winged helix-turn-helix transcriptional regulator n=1 Tax=Burkholderia sp. Bp8963 TaxID=2184547 RepID=UPI000F5B28EC|nr:MarR family transcriptional regulator [Burkholderia sp. Bp8963]RQS62574.1 MarR family transcriptional regulator [Burkholderia sp. Bp8963]
MEHYTPRNFFLTESVGFLLNKARNVITAEMDTALKEFGITSQQMGILLAIHGRWASTPFELSKLLAVDTGLMTRMLDKLETKELLARSRSEEDRRVVNLALTAKGIDVAARLPANARKVLNARLGTFSPEEFEQLLALLRKFIGD